METIVIIGAGASGLACMNELVKTNKYNIIVLEQSNKAARKILASGNGRCNVSNLNMDIKYYNHQEELGGSGYSSRETPNRQTQMNKKERRKYPSLRSFTWSEDPEKSEGQLLVENTVQE